MATMPDMPEPSLDLREQVARIDQMHAMIQQALANAAKTQQETRLAPWSMLFAALGAASAFFAAGIAVAKYLVG